VEEEHVKPVFQRKGKILQIQMEITTTESASNVKTCIFVKTFSSKRTLYD